MKNLLNLAFVFLLLITSSCSNENTDVILPQPDAAASQELVSNLTNYAATASRTNQQTSYVNNNPPPTTECFTLNFPYTVTDGVNITVINSDEELQNFINGLPANAPWAIELPFSVTLDDGSQLTIGTENDLFFLLQECGFVDITDNVDYFDNCLELNYPLDVIDLDGNQITVNSDEELYTLPNFVEFAYPITGTLEDGTAVTINSPEEFDTIYNECYGIDDIDDCLECDVDYVNCFEVVFPMSFVNQDGAITTVNDEVELYDFLSQLSPTDYIIVSYPINVELEDGTQIAINSDEELVALLEDCIN